jgi:hypothetical protein
MTSSTEHFVTLLVGVLSILAMTCGALRVLWVISWRMGQLVERFDRHAEDEKTLHVDIESRLREIERGQGGRRRT